MLEEERAKYVDFISSELKGFLPDILNNEEEFMMACKFKKSNWVATKKKVTGEGEEVEINKDAVSINEEEEDDADDVPKLLTLVQCERLYRRG